MKVGIFAGTTEGRLLAEYCCREGISAFASVVSGYGAELLPKDSRLEILVGALSEAELEALISSSQVELVVDATHPYASEITGNLREACRRAGCEYVRCVRSPAGGADGNQGHVVNVSGLSEAVRYLKEQEGNILVTTGSKELSSFTELPDYQERVYLRALPSVEALEKSGALGITGRHMICMQGPFSQEMNEALIRQFQIRYLVTKEAGDHGGYEEKIGAAAACGITAVVIGRPSVEEGSNLTAVKDMLKRFRPKEPVKVSLVGIGMGGEEQMTRRAERAILESDAILGARRMVESVGHLAGEREICCAYLPKDVVRCIEENQNWRQVCVVFSGDTGFYSGAAGLIAKLKESCIAYEVIPGISSASYLSAALGVSWEDAHIASLHGREFDVAEALKTHKKLFLLTGGSHSVSELCAVLVKDGFGAIRMAVGEKLSYSDERIVRGTAEELLEMEFSSLSAVYIEWEQPGGQG